jgi:hypothetical protein
MLYGQLQFMNDEREQRKKKSCVQKRVCHPRPLSMIRLDPCRVSPHGIGIERIRCSRSRNTRLQTRASLSIPWRRCPTVPKSWSGERRQLRVVAMSVTGHEGDLWDLPKILDCRKGFGVGWLVEVDMYHRGVDRGALI